MTEEVKGVNPGKLGRAAHAAETLMGAVNVIDELSMEVKDLRERNRLAHEELAAERAAHAETKAAREVLVPSAVLANLTATQKRCTELLLRARSAERALELTQIVTRGCGPSWTANAIAGTVNEILKIEERTGEAVVHVAVKRLPPLASTVLEVTLSRDSTVGVRGLPEVTPS